MDIKYVHGVTDRRDYDGFELDGGTRLIRVPHARLPILIDRPEFEKAVIFRARRDAVATSAGTSFPGDQHSVDLHSSIEVTIKGEGTLQTTTLSSLGGTGGLKSIEVRIKGVSNDVNEELPRFSVKWRPKDSLLKNGDFVLEGCIAYEETKFLVEELQENERVLIVNLSIGLFPGFFGVMSTDGWAGGELTYANEEICEKFVQNAGHIPQSFYCPEKISDTDGDTRAPFNLVEFKIEKRVLNGLLAKQKYRK